jgi:hypothetical protein
LTCVGENQSALHFEKWELGQPTIFDFICGLTARDVRIQFSDDFPTIQFVY